MGNKIKSLIKKLTRFGYKVTPKDKKNIDPVCGMEAASVFFASEYKGKTYYFCSQHCKEKFDENPTDYISEK